MSPNPTAELPKTATKPEPVLGRLLTEDPGRDAIHIAIIPTVAKETLRPGQRVSKDGYAATMTARPPVGIVDPFLRQPVLEGQIFYLCLFPRTVTSLRHCWSHPAFADEGEKGAR